MLPSDPFILRAFIHWESGYFQNKMDCKLQVSFQLPNQTDLSASELLPELSTISFSVSDIARLANTYQLSEGFLNYLQRIRFDHSITVFSGQSGHLDSLLCIKASSVDFLLFAERLELWAIENMENPEAEAPPLKWIFSLAV